MTGGVTIFGESQYSTTPAQIASDRHEVPTIAYDVQHWPNIHFRHCFGKLDVVQGRGAVCKGVDGFKEILTNSDR